MRSCRRGRGLFEFIWAPHASKVTAACFCIKVLKREARHDRMICVAGMYPAAWRGLRLCASYFARGASSTGLPAHINTPVDVTGQFWPDVAARGGPFLLCASSIPQAPAMPAVNRSDLNRLLRDALLKALRRHVRTGETRSINRATSDVPYFNKHTLLHACPTAPLHTAPVRQFNRTNHLNPP